MPKIKPPEKISSERAEYVKVVVRRLYDAQKLRIQSDLRLQRLVRDGIVVKEDIERTFTKTTEMEAAIEHEYEKIVWREIKGLPIVVEWLSRVKGIGPRLGGLLIANILDIGRFANVSKLHAYAGLHVVDGKAAKRAKGQKANWNGELKTTCWKIANSFVKQKDSRFREWYERYKARIIAREIANGNIIWKGDEHKREVAFAPKALQADPPKAPKNPEWTLGRVHNMALRYIVKLFLSLLWQKWRELDGLPVGSVYIEGKPRDPDDPRRGVHETMIQPDEVIDE